MYLTGQPNFKYKTKTTGSTHSITLSNTEEENDPTLIKVILSLLTRVHSVLLSHNPHHITKPLPSSSDDPIPSLPIPPPYHPPLHTHIPPLSTNKTKDDSVIPCASTMTERAELNSSISKRAILLGIERSRHLQLAICHQSTCLPFR